MTNVITMICSEWMIILLLSQQLIIGLSRSTTSSCSQVQSPGEVRKKAASVSFFLTISVAFYLPTMWFNQSHWKLGRQSQSCASIIIVAAIFFIGAIIIAIIFILPKQSQAAPQGRHQVNPLHSKHKNTTLVTIEMKIKSSITTICICLMLIIRGEQRGTSSQRWRRLFFNLFFIFL